MRDLLRGPHTLSSFSVSGLSHKRRNECPRKRSSCQCRKKKSGDVAQHASHRSWQSITGRQSDVSERKPTIAPWGSREASSRRRWARVTQVAARRLAVKSPISCPSEQSFFSVDRGVTKMEVTTCFGHPVDGWIRGLTSRTSREAQEFDGCSQVTHSRRACCCQMQNRTAVC